MKGRWRSCNARCDSTDSARAKSRSQRRCGGPEHGLRRAVARHHEHRTCWRARPKRDSLARRCWDARGNLDATAHQDAARSMGPPAKT